MRNCERTNRPGECGARIDEVLRGTAAEVWDGASRPGARRQIDAELHEALEPLLKEIESLNERIKEYDARMEKIAKERYPEVALLKQVKGVGTLIALTYVLTLEDPHRFGRVASRMFFVAETWPKELRREPAPDANQQRMDRYLKR